MRKFAYNSILIPLSLSEIVRKCVCMYTIERTEYAYLRLYGKLK